MIRSFLGLRHLVVIFTTGRRHRCGQQLLLARSPSHVIGVRHKPLTPIQVCAQHKGVLLHPGDDGPDFSGYLGMDAMRSCFPFCPWSPTLVLGIPTSYPNPSDSSSCPPGSLCQYLRFLSAAPPSRTRPLTVASGDR